MIPRFFHSLSVNSRMIPVFFVMSPNLQLYCPYGLAKSGDDLAVFDDVSHGKFSGQACVHIRCAQREGLEQSSLAKRWKRAVLVYCGRELTAGDSESAQVYPCLSMQG